MESIDSVGIAGTGTGLIFIRDRSICRILDALTLVELGRVQSSHLVEPFLIRRDRSLVRLVGSTMITHRSILDTTIIDSVDVAALRARDHLDLAGIDPVTTTIVDVSPDTVGIVFSVAHHPPQASWYIVFMTWLVLCPRESQPLPPQGLDTVSYSLRSSGFHATRLERLTARRGCDGSRTVRYFIRVQFYSDRGVPVRSDVLEWGYVVGPVSFYRRDRFGLSSAPCLDQDPERGMRSIVRRSPSYGVSTIDVAVSGSVVTLRVRIAHDPVVVWEISPNPAGSTTTVALIMRDAGYLLLEVYDAIGELQHSERRELVQGRNLWKLDLAELPNGSYLISVRVKEFTAGTRLMIVRAQ